MAKEKNAGWPVERVGVERDGRVLLTLGPAPPAERRAAELLRAEADRAVDELKGSEPAQALLCQRDLLASSRQGQAAAQAAAAQARADRATALGKGDGPAATKAEARLKAALADIDVIGERVASLLEAIQVREGECVQLWAQVRERLYRRLNAGVAARLDAAKAALSAAMPAALVAELVAAAEQNVALAGDWNMSSFCPANPLGRTPEPPPPPREPDPILARPNYGPLPTISAPVRCSHCREDCYVTTDGVKRESVLTCPRCGPRNAPAGHALEAHLKRVVEAEPPLEAAEEPAGV